MPQTEPTYSSSTLETDAEEHAALANEDAVILGSNVERLRVAAGYNMTRFADHADITRPTLYDIERGIANPRLSLMRKLARALGVTVADLLTPPKQD